jgi:hypothetical protein
MEIPEPWFGTNGLTQTNSFRFNNSGSQLVELFGFFLLKIIETLKRPLISPN